jgi:uncharacterized protein YqgC (DUF456 family)
MDWAAIANSASGWVMPATVVSAAVLGVALTLLTLSGAWLPILVAVLVEGFWVPGTFSWWTIGVCVVLAGMGELTEFVAGSVGAAKAGSSKRGALGAAVGSLVGAVVGTVVLAMLPVIGTLIGAVAGAAAGAILVERGVVGKTWSASATAGAGAAAGRLVAVIVKSLFAVAVAVVLSVAVFVP